MSGYEVRYAQEDVPRPGVVRSLMENGVWKERPADAERYEGLKPIVETKARYLTMSSLRDDPPERRIPPRKRGRVGGVKKGFTRFPTSIESIMAKRNTGASWAVVAREAGCSVDLLYKRARESREKVIPRLCMDCKQPTGRPQNAKRCIACTDKWKYRATKEKRIGRPESAPCTEPGCKRPGTYSLGLCSLHYQRQRLARLANV